MKKYLFLSVLVIFMVCIHTGAYAENPPHVDNGFPYVTPGGSEALVIAREKYDPATREQSIYVRIFDQTSEWHGAAGAILFPPHIKIKTVYHLNPPHADQYELEASDPIWGIEGATYDDGSQNFWRGLDPENPDILEWTGHGVNFYLNFSYGIDDFRIIVTYDDCPEDTPGYFDVVLYRGTNFEERSYINNVMVGSGDGTVPGDGTFTDISFLRVPLTGTDTSQDNGDDLEDPDNEILPAEINIDPDTLNLKSRGRWITCYIALAQGNTLQEIDIASIILTTPEGQYIHAENFPTGIEDNNADGISHLMVKFNRSALQALLMEGEQVLTVSGLLFTGESFAGSDTIRVKGAVSPASFRTP